MYCALSMRWKILCNFKIYSFAHEMRFWFPQHRRLKMWISFLLFLCTIFASLCKRQRRSATLSENVIFQWNGHHFTRFDKQNGKVVDKFHAEILRPNGSRRETNPLPKRKTQKITIKCIDFPSQISIFFVFFLFCVFMFSFHALQSHRRAQCMMGWMIVVICSSEWFMCLLFYSRAIVCEWIREKGTRHCSSLSDDSYMCVRALLRSVYLHTMRRSNQFDCIEA